MCVDPKGRLIVSDQYGKLYRVTPPPIGGDAGDDEGRADRRRHRRGPGPALGVRQPLRRRQPRRASTRAACTASRDTERRRHARQGRAAPQARRRRRARPARRRRSRPTASRSTSSPATRRKLTELAGSLRAAGSGARTTSCPACPTATASWPTSTAPGGCIYASTPTARTGSWCRSATATSTTRPSTAHGDLFTYDADMEWDINTPWYRPTRVCQVDQRQRVRLAQRRGQVAGLLPRQPAAGRQHRPRLADRRDASATGRSSRRSIRRRSSSATGATASSTPST